MFYNHGYPGGADLFVRSLKLIISSFCLHIKKSFFGLPPGVKETLLQQAVILTPFRVRPFRASRRNFYSVSFHRSAFALLGKIRESHNALHEAL